MFSNIYNRVLYYNKIKGFIKNDLIKVITGIRRCGKSSFMKSIVNTLLNDGINGNDIIYIDLDAKENLSINSAKKREKLIDKKYLIKIINTYSLTRYKMLKILSHLSTPIEKLEIFLYSSLVQIHIS